jgi:hypothetical protein
MSRGHRVLDLDDELAEFETRTRHRSCGIFQKLSVSLKFGPEAAHPDGVCRQQSRKLQSGAVSAYLGE